MRVDHKVLSWAFYDWANSAFATVVMAGFFPLFFKQYWAAGLPVTESTFRLGAANSLAGMIIVAVAPLLGAIADRIGARKRFLLLFAALGVVMTGALYLVAAGAWVAAVALYCLAVLGFMGGNIFYDALLLEVAPPGRLDFVSALGFALGYLGGGLLFAFTVAMTLWPAAFGLADAAAAVRVSFLCVALWWALFSIPLALFVRAPPAPARGGAWENVRGGWRQLAATFREVRRLKTAALFLLAYWLYIDGVDTIVRMAVDYGLALGFDANVLITALLVTQFVGFPAALAFGRLGERLGTKTGIFIAIAVYLAVTAWAALIERAAEFYVMAVAIGLVQGGIQSLSRSFYARLIPPAQAAQFFGFYNMLGKFAAVLGPVLMGWVSVATGSPRASVAAIAVLFVLGGALLWFVDEGRSPRGAA